jgi:hypothetical protein
MKHPNTWHNICHVVWAYRALEGQIRFSYGVFYAKDDSTMYEHATASLQMQMDSRNRITTNFGFKSAPHYGIKPNYPLEKFRFVTNLLHSHVAKFSSRCLSPVNGKHG